MLQSIRAALLVLLMITMMANSSYGQTAPLVNPSVQLLIEEARQKYPDNTKYISAYIRMNFAAIQRYQKYIAQCIERRGTPIGCSDLITSNPNMTEEEKDKEPVKELLIKDGVITIVPNTKVFSFLHENDTIIATPSYNNKEISWSYSGGLFNASTAELPSGVSYCPPTSELSSSIQNGQMVNHLNRSWMVSIAATGKPVEAISNNELSFAWATTQKVPNGKIVCVYKINTDKRPYYVALYSQSALTKNPESGLWNIESPGFCRSKNASPTDCPFNI
ncbi:TPA: hypothetical protein ACPSKB_002528 [Legionella feeleii]|uniref:Legionella vir region protein n=1 Tax=Legionella feeleii TaxID=453 RepID=A0A378IYA9_9GAMM|nr:hypothetical protein [Legionella feeleii]STX39535.1 Uncharacterised protein [Legionella feeleii]